MCTNHPRRPWAANCAGPQEPIENVAEPREQGEREGPAVGRSLAYETNRHT